MRRASDSTTCSSRWSRQPPQSSWLHTAWGRTPPARSSSQPATIPSACGARAAFAHLCGVAPIDASSGLTSRKRLNRGGDRSANHALWRIVMVRMVFDARTRAYVTRRTAEGRSKREIIRSLKRSVAASSIAACLALKPLDDR